MKASARGADRASRRRRPTRPKSAREIALNVLYHVDTRKAFADLLLNKALRESSLEPRDAALATELINGTLRWRARIDWILERYVRTGLDTLSPWILNLLRLGVYQVVFLDRIPDHAVVDEGVKLARRYGHSGTAGLTNAVLRKFIHDRGSWPDPETEIEDPAEALAVAGSHPQWLVNRWLRRLGEEETRALMEANNRARPLSLRVNSGRTDRESLRASLAANGIETTAATYSRLSLSVSGNMVPGDLSEFRAGQFFVQDESETLAGELIGAERGETVLDLCAAPGGKACHVQESRGSEGLLLAVDAQRNRLLRVRENQRRLGLDNMELVVADGRALSPGRPVDRVLVDAPCSGLGVLGRRSDARWRKTEASMRALLPLERELLASGACWVKPGGVLVYSVCSTEPEEGRKQIDAFLRDHEEFKLEDASTYVSADVVTDGCLLLYPHRHGTDGAFAARMRRRG